MKLDVFSDKALMNNIKASSSLRDFRLKPLDADP